MSPANLPWKGLFVVVIGCGKLGSYVADHLSRGGANVAVLDPRKEAFSELPGSYSGFTIEADATEYQRLQEARIDKADALFACTDDDNVNIMVAQAARDIFGVATVMARVYEGSREELCRALGISTICPARVAGTLFLDAMGLTSRKDD